MFNQLKSYLFAATLFTAIGFLATAARSAEPKQVLVSGLTVTKTSSSSVGLSWSGWSGSGDYTVTVLNLTTSQIEQQFSTPNTVAAVSNLTTGDSYRFSVEKAGYVITEEVLM
jgi:hypothetical protein